MLPPRLRASVWSRFYRPTNECFRELFDDAALHFARHISMRLLPGDIISDSIAFTGTYDLPLSRMLLRLAKEGGLLVDVGANLGYFSLLWASVDRRNEVVSFEASPRNFELLKLNVARNRLEDRIEVRSEAVGKERGKMQFDPGPKDQTGWGGLSLDCSERSQLVQVVTLDDALADVEQISLLKIDIEGADTWALLGAERLLRERRIEHIWWEQHKSRMRKLNITDDHAAKYLEEIGYHPISHGDRHGETVNWYAS